MTNIKKIKEFSSQVIALDGIEIANPIVLNEISFVPIIKQRIPREERSYLTLSEALEENSCEIIEKGTEVAHIIFKNMGDLPILIEEGEIFHGQGTQDRICISTIMVEPDTQIEIPVKCVHAPHYLSAGAGFAYGGKASRKMLNELRNLKFKHAAQYIPTFSIDQGHVWETVAQENAMEDLPTETQYMKSVEKRKERAKKRSKNLSFPKNTIGVVVINQEGEIKGVEIHRSPHNFNIRKDGILESLEANIDWDEKGKGPYQNSGKITQELFKKLSQLKEGKDVLNQVEVNGAVINMEGLTGEVFTSPFYSDTCPSCGKSKPRKKMCPNCQFEEEDSEEFAYMSLM
ncbi:MAG: ARPP-1 family domain-containing protein [Promethearchaeota archaeon]